MENIALSYLLELTQKCSVHTRYSKMAAILVFFCFLLNFEATRANLQVNKRILKLWLATRFKIMTSCTCAFLPRIIVYNRYVWAFIPYTSTRTQPFISRIYAYIRVFNTRICAKSNARLYVVLKTVYSVYAYLSKPTYTRAKSVRICGVQKSDLV